MLRPEDNELLVRVGPGTGMGELFRRFWVPVMVSEEVADRDGTPVRVNALGEKLVAFRDTNGKLGLLDAYCPHRRANLFWGRNEECGLRCVYHGWKFDVDGNCLDVPNATNGDAMKHTVKTKSYPVREQGGLVWAYLGPRGAVPKMPAAEVFNAPPQQRYISKMVVRGNWAQLMEGDVDSSHVSFLHSDTVRAVETRVGATILQDKRPHWMTKATDYGLMLAARRSAGDDRYSWRVNHWLMPFTTLVAALPDTPILAQVRVPIDDETSMLFRVLTHPTRPLSEAELASTRDGVFFPEMIPHTFTPKENMGNDYLIDRKAQKAGSFTGIKSIPAQDLAVTQDQDGPIMDRSREMLTTADVAIVALRKRVLTAAKELLEGREPAEPQRPESYCVRPIEVILPRDVEIEVGAEELMRGAPIGEAA